MAAPPVVETEAVVGGSNAQTISFPGRKGKKEGRARVTSLNIRHARAFDCVICAWLDFLARFVRFEAVLWADVVVRNYHRQAEHSPVRQPQPELYAPAAIGTFRLPSNTSQHLHIGKYCATGISSLILLTFTLGTLGSY